MSKSIVKILLRVVFLAFAVGQCTVLQGQIQLHDQRPYMSDDDLLTLQQQIKNLKENKDQEGIKLLEADIFNIRGSYYLCPDGTFEVYQFDGDSLNNISQSTHFGYNHASYKFTHKGVLYSLGGYGFWRSHADLVAFNMDNRKWEIVPVSGDKPPGIAASSTYINGNSIITFNAYNLDQSIQDLRTELGDVFELDLEAKEWRKIGFVNAQVLDNINPVHLESKRFTFNPITPQAVLDKVTRLIKIANTTMLDKSGRELTPMLYHIMGDSVLIYNEREVFLDLDLKTLYAETDVTVINLIQSKKKYGFFIIGGGILLLAFVLIAYYLKASRKDPKGKEHSLARKLLESGQRSFSLEAIDVLFNLDSIVSNETRRFKRAALINEINDSYKKIYGNELITRVKDPDDKRRFIYVLTT